MPKSKKRKLKVVKPRSQKMSFAEIDSIVFGDEPRTPRAASGPLASFANLFPTIAPRYEWPDEIGHGDEIDISDTNASETLSGALSFILSPAPGTLLTIDEYYELTEGEQDNE